MPADFLEASLAALRRGYDAMYGQPARTPTYFGGQPAETAQPSPTPVAKNPEMGAPIGSFNETYFGGIPANQGNEAVPAQTSGGADPRTLWQTFLSMFGPSALTSTAPQHPQDAGVHSWAHYDAANAPAVAQTPVNPQGTGGNVYGPAATNESVAIGEPSTVYPTGASRSGYWPTETSATPAVAAVHPQGTGGNVYGPVGSERTPVAVQPSNAPIVRRATPNPNEPVRRATLVAMPRAPIAQAQPSSVSTPQQGNYVSGGGMPAGYWQHPERGVTMPAATSSHPMNNAVALWAQGLMHKVFRGAAEHAASPTPVNQNPESGAPVGAGNGDSGDGGFFQWLANFVSNGNYNPNASAQNPEVGQFDLTGGSDYAPRAELVDLPAGQGAAYDPTTYGITPQPGTETPASGGMGSMGNMGSSIISGLGSALSAFSKQPNFTYTAPNIPLPTPAKFEAPTLARNTDRSY